MNANDFKRRTQEFALRVLQLVGSIPEMRVTGPIGKQLLRSGTSVGSNYRSACRAQSRADFIAKLKIVEEECDETLYWMELLIQAGILKPAAIGDLAKEANEILSLVVASIRTARSNQ